MKIVHAIGMHHPNLYAELRNNYEFNLWPQTVQCQDEGNKQVHRSFTIDLKALSTMNAFLFYTNTHFKCTDIGLYSEVWFNLYLHLCLNQCLGMVCHQGQILCILNYWNCSYKSISIVHLPENCVSIVRQGCKKSDLSGITDFCQFSVK